MPTGKPKANSGGALFAASTGIAFGALITVPAMVAAIMSGGAGQGPYVAARALFPLAMLLTRVEGEIDWILSGIALFQFPVYGALIGICRWRRPYGVAALVAFLHVAAAIACFGGALPAFS